jgi:hypothetical protein
MSFIKLYTHNSCPGNTQGGKVSLELEKNNDTNL